MIVFLATATPRAPSAAWRGCGLLCVELGHVSLGEVPRLAPGIVLIAHGDAGQALQGLDRRLRHRPSPRLHRGVGLT